MTEHPDQQVARETAPEVTRSDEDQVSHERRLSMARVVLRPIGTPLPLGFLGLVVGTAGFSSLQLGWVPEAEANIIALGTLVLTVPLQLIAMIFGVLARDPVAGTGMGVLGATWAVVASATLLTPPGTDSAALGVLLVVAGLAILVPIAAALSKIVVAVVMIGSGIRFSMTGTAELTGMAAWEQAAGVAGLALAALAAYAALALQIEDTENRTVLPLLRRGSGKLATQDDIGDQLVGVGREAGVRQQL